MQGNLDIDRLREYYNKCDSTWDGTSMNSNSIRSDDKIERMSLPVFDRESLKNNTAKERQTSVTL